MASDPERPICLSQCETAFGFTEKERLYDRIRDARFLALLHDEQTTVHQVAVDTNSFGEYLFVTLGRPGADTQRLLVTFFGLGYHEQRERWITEDWGWYTTTPMQGKNDEAIPKAEAEHLVQERRAQIAPYISDIQPSKRAQLFALFADLTDEDGAYSEIEDLEGLTGGFFDDEE